MSRATSNRGYFDKTDQVRVGRFGLSVSSVGDSASFDQIDSHG